MEQVVRLGVDLAKRVIQVHGVGQREQVVLRRAVSAERFAEFMVRMTPCVVAMDGIRPANPH